MTNFNSLTDLGWQAFFQQQLSLEEWDESIPARVIEQYKTEITVVTESGTFNIQLLANMPEIVVGDWLLLDNEKHVIRLLDRKTCFARKAAGSKLKRQLISANVDTAFIVTSMNDDFNLSRIERFLSLVNEANADPVVLLSKSDLTDTPQEFVETLKALDPFLMVESINCLDSESVKKLSPWLQEGVTVAVLGSSGVGKSTLINTLLGEERQSTKGIREDDDKGRHTTTSRSLISLGGKGAILDTPGMREIQMVDSKDGITKTFADIESLAERCKFSDCQHQSEPGCAVQQAVETNELDQRRLNNYFKLLREESHNSATLSERRSMDKAFGKTVKRVMSEKKKTRGRS